MYIIPLNFKPPHWFDGLPSPAQKKHAPSESILTSKTTLIEFVPDLTQNQMQQMFWLPAAFSGFFHMSLVCTARPEPIIEPYVFWFRFVKVHVLPTYPTEDTEQGNHAIERPLG